MYLLDTNVVSEMRKAEAGRAAPQLVSWLATVPRSELLVSAITLYELEIGVLLAERRDPVQGAVLRRWLDDWVMPSFADRILTVDELVAKRAAVLMVPNPAPYRDSLIAATALVHGVTVATRNVRDFERFASLAVVDPWM